MACRIIVDTTANLPLDQTQKLGIEVFSTQFELDGKAYICPLDLRDFDAKGYYDALRAGVPAKTSLINAARFLEVFRPVLEAGDDIVYVGLSSGVSGTIQSARIAAEQLREEYPERHIAIVDSLGAGLGVGLIACHAADWRNAGHDFAEIVTDTLRYRDNLRQYFTVDDIMFLRRGGRISGAKAVLGTVLQIKPILYGSEAGKIEMIEKARGRRGSISRIAQLYRETAVDPQHGRVAISHGDCEEDAAALAEQICAIAQPGELIVEIHEPMTGAHVGPGMLALFFEGNGR